MTNEVAKILAGSLEPLYNAQIITVLCGLVKTVTQEKVNNTSTVRFPVPYDTDSATFQMANSDLVPSARQRAIIYFEGSDTDITAFEPLKSKASTDLRLVCWYNSSQYESVDGHSVHSILASQILKMLWKANPEPNSVIAGMKTEVTRMYDSAATLFSRYSYREEYAQYLQNPYFSLGIDMTVTYQINHGCTPELLAINAADCC